jgi:hypothetical protein
MKSILFALFISLSLSLSQFPLSSIDSTQIQSVPASTTQSHQYIFEDFTIVDVTPQGEIYGELITGKGEGILLLQSQLSSILDAPTKLVVGDEIEIAWTIQDYQDENWENIHSIEFLN